MSGNNGWSGLNSPSFLKSINGITSLLLGFPLSSASRTISRTLKGAPPQYLASYLAKYQPQLGSRKFGSPMLVPGLLPQISKATLRTAAGVFVSIVATLGRPWGTGKGPAGSFISRGGPSTTTVVSATGYCNIVGGWAAQGSAGATVLAAAWSPCFFLIVAGVATESWLAAGHALGKSKL